jgi:hypothetical protein
MFQKLLSRDEWLKHGRVVIAANEEAKDVCNFYIRGRWGVAGARHVFTDDQTLPLEQFQSEVAA